MADITKYTDKIASAIYGEEVRGSIINALKASNAESTEAFSKVARAEELAVLADNAVKVAQNQIRDCERIVNTKVVGFSPSVNVSKSGRTSTITVTDRSGRTSTTLVDGVTFTPVLNERGVLSFTNDGGLINPNPINLTGPVGRQGDPGAKITRVSNYYAAYTSGYSPPSTSNFSTSIPSLSSSTRYMWKYSRFYLSDGTSFDEQRHVCAVYGAATTVVNNLSSTSTSDALSAAQGRVLDKRISDLESAITRMLSTVSQLQTQISDIKNGLTAVLVKK